MMSRRSRLALFTLLAGGIALAGCANNPTSTTTPPPGKAQTTGSSTRTTAAPRTGGSSGAATTRPRAGTTSSPESGTPPPGSTGIPACDDYLASYVACHRTAAIYPPDQIEGHYEAMRDSLLRDAQDPNTRPQLGGRCTSLAQTLRQALHGKACGPTNPAAPASSPGTGR